MHNKPDSFSGKLSPNPKNDDSWTPIVFEHSQKVLIEARVICTDNYYGELRECLISTCSNTLIHQELNAIRIARRVNTTRAM